MKGRHISGIYVIPRWLKWTFMLRKYLELKTVLRLDQWSFQYNHDSNRFQWLEYSFSPFDFKKSRMSGPDSEGYWLPFRSILDGQCVGRLDITLQRGHGIPIRCMQWHIMLKVLCENRGVYSLNASRVQAHCKIWIDTTKVGIFNVTYSHVECKAWRLNIQGHSLG